MAVQIGLAVCTGVLLLITIRNGTSEWTGVLLLITIITFILLLIHILCKCIIINIQTSHFVLLPTSRFGKAVFDVTVS